jgi:NAD(P)-dependent dehydrogenase (short-subunit alcohol dehydrogenase family)
MPSILITGANRGLGLTFVKQYAAHGWRIFACCRDPEDAGALNAVAGAAGDTVSVHALDITDGASVAALADELSGQSIDVLLNNAGAYLDKGVAFGAADFAAWEQTFRINTLGPMRMAEAFVGHVARSERKQIVCISSKMGSQADNTSGGAYAYRASKAALNAVVRSLTADLKDQGITAVVFHPGWVATDMGGDTAPVTPAASVHGLREAIEGLSPADSGRFLNYDGSEIPW